MNDSDKTVTMSMDEYNRLMKIEINQDKIKLFHNNLGFGYCETYSYVGENEALNLLIKNHKTEIQYLTEKSMEKIQNLLIKNSALEIEIEELTKKLNKKHWWNK